MEALRQSSIMRYYYGIITNVWNSLLLIRIIYFTICLSII